jgi:crotonobetainyl-CoA:carnitine CoA-transferase CaiB-like acyl-CoA transferase
VRTEPRDDGAPDAPDAFAWAASGAMALTGHADGPPLLPRGPVMTRLRATARAIAAASSRVGTAVDLEPELATVLTGRAAQLGLHRHGRRSAAGATRLLPAADGWVAISLARLADIEAVPAVVEAPVRDGDAWPALIEFAARAKAHDVAARGQLFGIPTAALPQPSEPAVPSVRIVGAGASRAAPAPDRPLVIDLSSMWAGPLCAHVLGRAGMRIVKVEAVHRPDGARAGDQTFFDWLHAGHESVALDLGTDAGVRSLHALIAHADIVIEASRPRALLQLGIDARAAVAARPGTTWVSITGYGRDGDHAQLVAFGDDAAVAGGLVADDRDGAPVFAGDAIADPLTGLVAAHHALAAHLAGGGAVVDVAMAGVAATVGALAAEPGEPCVVERAGTEWIVRSGAQTQVVAEPQPIVGAAPGEALGASTARVLAEFAET